MCCTLATKTVLSPLAVSSSHTVQVYIAFCRKMLLLVLGELVCLFFGGGISALSLSDAQRALKNNQIVELLDKVPVFSLVDGEGNAAIVSENGGPASLEFFLDARHAMSRKSAMKEGDSLRLTGQSLGRAYVAYEGNEELNAKFFADPVELSAARQVILRSVDPDAAATNMNFKELEAAYSLADPDRRFSELTDIPLFSVAQLVLATSTQEEGETLPWFFSMKDCVDQWKKACGDNIKAYEEGELKLLSLKEILTKLRDTNAPSSSSSSEHEDAQQRGPQDPGWLFIPTRAALTAVGVPPPPES